MNRIGSISIVVVVLVIVAIAIAGWYLLRDADAVDGPPVAPPAASDANSGQSGASDGRSVLAVGNAVATSNSQGTAPPAIAPTLAGGQGNPTELRGTVQDEHGNRIKDATIQIIHYDFDQDPTKRIHDRFLRRVIQETATDEDGTWKIEKLTPSNKHYISGSAPGYLEQIKDNVQVGLIVNFTLRKGARVEGYIVDVDSGKPVEGAKVRGWYKTGAHVRNVGTAYRWQETRVTKADGAFVFDGAPVAKVKWMLYHSEYEDYVEDVAVSAGVANRLTFKMQRGVAIEGVVKNKLRDTPIEGVDVHVTDVLVPKFATKTDENGRFRVTGLKPGAQIFTFNAGGFTAARSPTQIGVGDNYDPKQNNLFEFYLDPTGTAAGVIYDPDGRPIENARVFVARRNPLMNQVRAQSEFRTKADGQFLVADLGTDADHLIVAHRDGFGIGVSEPFRVGPEELRDNVVVRLNRGGAISGVVRDENDIAVGGVRIEVAIPPFADAWFPPGFDLGQQSSKTIVTDQAGRYALDGLWKGSFTFNLTHELHVAIEDQRVALKETEEHLQQDFRMQIGRFLAGTCMDQGGGPAEGSFVSVTRPFAKKVEARATVDKDGNWRIDGLVKGTYNVQARKEGFTSEMMSEVPADTDNLHFRLRENGVLIGSVAGPKGEPVKRFMIALRPQDDGSMKSLQWSMGNAKPARSFGDPGGNFHYPALQPGDYIVTVRCTDYPDLVLRNVHVPSGGAGNVNATMRGGGALTGTVRDPSGTPIVDAVVTVNRRHDRSNREAVVAQKAAASSFESPQAEAGEAKNSARPGPDGTYRIKGIAPGQYSVTVTSTRYVGSDPETITMAEGQEIRHDLTLSLSGELTITITDDFGDPVVGAALMIRDDSGRKPMSVRGGPRTDNLGLVTFTGIPSGTFKLSVTRSGYIAKESNLTMPPGGQLSQAFQLERIR